MLIAQAAFKHTVFLPGLPGAGVAGIAMARGWPIACISPTLGKSKLLRQEQLNKSGSYLPMLRHKLPPDTFPVLSCVQICPN